MNKGFIKIDTDGVEAKKGVSDGLINPNKLYMESMQSNGLKNPKNDILERNNDKLLTNDGREMLNEKK